MKTIERLYQYFDFKGIKPTRFEKDFGLGNGYLGKQFSRKADIGTTILETIIDNCPDLNLEWLITGAGSMIRIEGRGNQYSKKDDPPDCKMCEMKDLLIESQRQQIETLSKFISHLEENKCPEEGQKRKVAS